MICVYLICVKMVVDVKFFGIKLFGIKLFVIVWGLVLRVKNVRCFCFLCRFVLIGG